MCHYQVVSTQRYETADGTRWRVRWRDGSGKMHSRSLTSKSEAKALDTDIKARKLRSEVLPVARSYILNRAWDDWLANKRTSLAATTLASYETLWEAHIRDTEFGNTPIGTLVSDPKLIDDHLNSLKARDAKNRRLPPTQQAKLGNASKRRLLMMLSGVFKQCVRWQKISVNPIREMEKPSATVQRKPRPFPPFLVERIRRQLLMDDEDELQGHRHAVLVSLLAYAGLRPQEALALQFRDIGKSTIAINKAIKLGTTGTVVGATKTEKERPVPLIAPLASDLSEWREALGSPSNDQPVIPSTNGKTWTVSMYRNWRQRIWKPALKALAASDANLAWLAQSRPYDCRGSFVSLHLRAGVPPIEVAAHAGHSLDVLYRHYAAVIEELAGDPPSSAETQIVLAREALAKKAPEDVAKLTAESLKPAKDVPPDVRAILYGDFPRSQPR